MPSLDFRRVAVGLDSEDTDTIYAKVEVVNRPTDFLRQKLSFSKTSELVSVRTSTTSTPLRVLLGVGVSEKTSIRPTLFYEYYEASGPRAEKAHRFGAALGIYQHFSENLTLGLDYRFLLKDSNLSEADYYQNLALVSLYYKF